MEGLYNLISLITSYKHSIHFIRVCTIFGCGGNCEEALRGGNEIGQADLALRLSPFLVGWASVSHEYLGHRVFEFEGP